MTFEEILKNLSSLPFELVEEVIQHLPFPAVIQLLGANNPNITACVRSSPSWKWVLILDIGLLVQLLETCTLIFSAFFLGPFPHLQNDKRLICALGSHVTSMIARFANDKDWRDAILLKEQKSPGTYVTGLSEGILWWIYYLREKYPVELKGTVLDIQTIHTYSLSMKDFGVLNDTFRNLIEAQPLKNKIMSEQLVLLAKMLERHPDRVRFIHDLSRIPVTNPAYLFDQLMHESVRVTTNNVLGKMFTRHLFSSEFPALIPHDHCLKLYREALILHPPSGVSGNNNLLAARIAVFDSLEQEVLDRSLKRRQCDQEWSTCTIWDSARENEITIYIQHKPLDPNENRCQCCCHDPDRLSTRSHVPAPHVYPLHIQNAIQLVNKGLFLSYAEQDQTREARILTECCVKVDPSTNPACDWTSAWKFRACHRKELRYGTQFKAIENEEMEWLAAFLNCVKYMEESFPALATEIMNSAQRVWKMERPEHAGKRGGGTDGSKPLNRHGNRRGPEKATYKFRSNILDNWTPAY
jgi:hypothetical protein